MKNGSRNIIRIALGAIFVASFVLNLAVGERWSKLFFAIMLAIISTYNLFFNYPSQGK